MSVDLRSFYRQFLKEEILHSNFSNFDLIFMTGNKSLGAFKWKLFINEILFNIVFVGTLVSMKCAYGGEFMVQLHRPDASEKIIKFIKKEINASRYV